LNTRIWLFVAVATLSKVFWEPIREGSPDPRDWPRGLRPVILLCAGAYLLATVLVLASGWIRSNDTLVQYNGDSFPVWSVTVLLWLVVLTLSLALSAALHTHPVISLLTFGTCVLPLLLTTAVTAGLTGAVTWIIVLALIVFAVVRARRRYAWFEFPVVLILVSAAVYVPLAFTPFGVGADLRPLMLMLMLGSIVGVAAPALAMAGYAPAEIAVTLGEWLVNRIRLETTGRPGHRVVLGVVLALGLLVFGYDVGRGLAGAEWDYRREAWLASAVTLVVAVIGCWLLLRNRPARPAEGPTAEQWTGYAYLLVIFWVAVIIPVTVLATVGGLLSAVLGDQGLAGLAGNLASSNLFSGLWRLGTVVLALVWAFRARRRGEWVAPVLLVCYAVLTSLGAVTMLTDARYGVSWSLPTLVALAVALCLLQVPIAILRRRGVERQLWIAVLALFISAMVGRRELLSEPGALAAGISGLAVLLFGLIWRVLTDAGITRRGTRWFPVPTRVLFYAANALFAAVIVAHVALTRQENPLLDLEHFAAVGENTVGTPLVLGAILLGALSGLGTPARSADQPRDTLPSAPEEETKTVIREPQRP
jgi:hypothetical protein